jgi:hypothetical protein
MPQAQSQSSGRKEELGTGEHRACDRLAPREVKFASQPCRAPRHQFGPAPQVTAPVPRAGQPLVISRARHRWACCGGRWVITEYHRWIHFPVSPAPQKRRALVGWVDPPPLSHPPPLVGAVEATRGGAPRGLAAELAHRLVPLAIVCPSARTVAAAASPPRTTSSSSPHARAEALVVCGSAPRACPLSRLSRGARYWRGRWYACAPPDPPSPPPGAPQGHAAI